MQSLFGLGSTADIDIRFDGEEKRTWVDVKVGRDQRDKFPLYADGETVTGKVTIRVKDGKKLEHNGIRVQFLGAIEMFPDKNPLEFISMAQELMAPGELRGLQTFDFEFKNIEKQYESYLGLNVKLRYFARVVISRRITDIVKEKDIWVYSYKSLPDENHPIKMEVGIEECLHIEFEYNKSRYHLSDVIVGKIYFLLVRIKIKHMELSILRRELSANQQMGTDSETLAKFEIMDGAPVKGETIPIRMFLSGYELTPSFRDVNKRFSIRYFLNLVLVDEENRRYFKQQEITMCRSAPDQAEETSPSRIHPRASTRIQSDHHHLQQQKVTQPFHFRRRRDRINWRVISSVDISHVRQNVDTSTLQDVIDTVAFGDIESDDLRGVDSNFVKLFHLSQLTIEYLLYCQNIMEQTELNMVQDLNDHKTELSQLEEQHERDLAEIYALKKEIKALKKTIFAYQVMIKVPSHNSHHHQTIHSTVPGTVHYHRCRYCPKIFNETKYLESHILRRHSDLDNYLNEEQSVQTEKQPELDPVIEQQQGIIDKLTKALQDLSDKVQVSELALREELELRLLESAKQRDEEHKQMHDQERVLREEELNALRQQMHAELESERAKLAAERAELDNLKQSMLNTQPSGIGEQLEDESVLDMDPLDDPVPPQPDVESLIENMEAKQMHMLDAFKEQVMQEMNNVKQHLIQSEDENKLAASQIEMSLAQRLEHLQALLVNHATKESKKQSKPPVQLPQLQIPSSSPVASRIDSGVHEPTSPTVVPKKRHSHKPPPIITHMQPTDPPILNNYEWPVLSRHLRSHKHISLPYAPWIKSAMTHLPLQVINMREVIQGDLNRALIHRGINSDTVSNPESLEALITLFEQDKEQMHTCDMCFGSMYDVIWDEMEALVAKMFRYKPRPILSPVKNSRFKSTSTTTTTNKSSLLTTNTWHTQPSSPNTPTRGGIRSLFRQSMNTPIRFPKQQLDWNTPHPSDSDSDDDSDTASQTSTRHLSPKSTSAFRHADVPSPKPNRWSAAFNKAHHGHNLRGPFSSPTVGSPLRKRFSETDSESDPSIHGGGANSKPTTTPALTASASTITKPTNALGRSNSPMLHTVPEHAGELDTVNKSESRLHQTPPNPPLHQKHVVSSSNEHMMANPGPNLILPTTTDASQFTALLNDLDAVNNGSAGPPHPRVIESQPAHNYSDWDVESI